MWNYCLTLRDEHKSMNKVEENWLSSPHPPPNQLLDIFSLKKYSLCALPKLTFSWKVLSRIPSILDTLEQPLIEYSVQGWDSWYVDHCSTMVWGIEDGLSSLVSLRLMRSGRKGHSIMILLCHSDGLTEGRHSKCVSVAVYVLRVGCVCVCVRVCWG